MEMKAEIIKGINENKDSFELRDEIVKFKINGGSQKEAYKILEEIRAEYQNNESKEDKVLELLDFVSGWCQEKYKIWDYTNKEI